MRVIGLSPILSAESHVLAMRNLLSLDAPTLELNHSQVNVQLTFSYMPNPISSLLKNPKLWQLALAGYWVLLIIGTHVPVNTPLMARSGADKFVHLVAYAGLAALLASAWQLAAGHLNPRHLILVWLVIVAYGAIDEWTQIPVGRSCSIWDWLADAVGAALGLALFVCVRYFIQRRNSPGDALH